MKRKSRMPYGETSLLSLRNLTPGTKFQCIVRLKRITEEKVLLSDEHEEIEIPWEKSEELQGKEEKVLLLFGKVDESGIIPEKILETNLDWDLYNKVREFESR
ncbi:MAG: hypothetical protein ACTSW1_04385 [Candidatus Hodarchaeales archaeon]